MFVFVYIVVRNISIQENVETGIVMIEYVCASLCVLSNY